MNEIAAALHDALVEALPTHLASRLEDLGVTSDDYAEEIRAATGRADGDLEVLLSMPFDRQQETPLEVVRRALDGVTAALEATGLEPRQRGDEQERVAPADRFGLAPASAAELGEHALQASLAWGVAKSAALTRPLLLVITSNLFDGSRFEEAASAIGYRVAVESSLTSDSTPAVAFVDLESPGADDAIRELSGRGCRVIAYGPHVDDLAMVRARTLGAHAAEPRSRMFRDPTAFLPPLV